MARIYKNNQGMSGMNNGYNSSSSSSYDSSYPSSSTNFGSVGSNNYSSNDTIGNGVSKRMRKSASFSKAGGGFFENLLELLRGVKKEKVVFPNKNMFDSRLSGTSYNASKDSAQLYLDNLRRERLIRDDYLDPSVDRAAGMPRAKKPFYEGSYSVRPEEFSSRGRKSDLELENLRDPDVITGVYYAGGFPFAGMSGKSTTPRKPLKSTTPRRPSYSQLMSGIEAPPVVARRGSNSQSVMVNGIPTKLPFSEMDMADNWLSGQPRNKIKNQTKLVSDKVNSDILSGYSAEDYLRRNARNMFLNSNKKTAKRLSKRANWPVKNKYFL